MRRVSLSSKPFVSFVILTIISLVPTPGFITLTIPDDTDGQNVTMPDFPHLSKRAFSDTDLHVDALVHSRNRLAGALELTSDVIFLSRIYVPAYGTYYFTIRAPPSA